MKLRRYKEKKISRYFTRGIIIIILGIISAILLIRYFSVRVSSLLLPTAEEQVRKYVTSIVNSATKGIRFDGEVFTINKDSDNEIKMITYDSYEATKLINDITDKIESELDGLENKNNDNEYILTEVPIGVIFGNKLVGNFGPKVAVRLDIIGDVLSELQTEVKPYGINNALVEVKVQLEVNARVILPFVSSQIKIENVIPLSINMVNGNIPDAYFSSYGGSG